MPLPGKQQHPVFNRRGFCFAVVFATLGCGSIDPGERTAARPLQVPDPVEFGTTVQPRLVTACGLAACHARDTTFTVHKSPTALSPSAGIIHPRDLPEPFRTDYFVVLAFCDLDIPESSPLLEWGGGQLPAHPGGKALTSDDVSEILKWLRSGGGSP